MSSVSRRRFLLATAGFAGAVTGLSAGDSRRSRAVSRRTFALGSPAEIVVLHRSHRLAERAIDAAFAALESVEAALSLYRPLSPVCRLNCEGSLDSPSPHLLTVLKSAADVSEATDGAFDVTVQPLWQLHAAAHRDGRRATDDELQAARSLVDWKKVEISPGRVRLRVPGAAVTLNGIAQGYAADRAATVLRDLGVEHALVNAGELRPIGSKDGVEDWTAGIQHPRQAEAYVALAKLNGRALATSGDYATSFSADKRDNHLLDPRTGRSPLSLASVSVAAPTAMLADALSTALFVLGPESFQGTLAKFPNVDALWVFKDGRVGKTAGFPSIA
jgi:FAD:protein FMN transferase